jgi:hypothetical protein
MKHANPARLSLALAAIAATGIAAAADEPQRRPPTPTPPPQSAITDIERVQPGARQGLLREGSHLLQARGMFAHDPETNAWRFTVEPATANAPVYVLNVQPTMLLSEAQHVVMASPEHRLVFEVTGEVLAYQGRNYLLLTQPPRVVGHSGAEEPATAPEDAPEQGADADQQQQTPPRRDAESIMRELEQQAGPAQRRPRIAPGGDVSERVRAINDDLRPEGSNIVMRRGRINRDATGAWLFVFEADASGMADPPMKLMPCLLLQQLQRHYQSRGNAPLLLSGRVFAYEGRNHLLPTVFQLPRERDMLTP